MPEDSFSETTHTGWLSRIGKSIKGVLFGIILIAVSFPVLWWNEGRSVRTAKGLAEGEKVTVDAASDKVDAANEGKLVHTTGRAEAKDRVVDEVFGVGAEGAIKVQRLVELYQWVESKSERTEKKVGGSEEKVTTYSYTQKWDDEVHNSSQFHQPGGHQNPEPAYNTEVFRSENTSLGAYRLPGFLISNWNDYRPLPLPSVEALPEAVRSKATVRGEWLYVGGNPDSPKLGDARVKFESVPAGDASVLAQQVKDTFQAYETAYGTTIARIVSGIQTKQAMFSAARSENSFMTWLIRLGGFLLMFIGAAMLLGPLGVLADVIPFIGNLVGAGTTFVAFLLAGIGSCVTIALAWVWYRPVLGISLLLIAAGAGFLLAKAMTKGKAIG